MTRLERIEVILKKYALVGPVNLHNIPDLARDIESELNKPDPAPEMPKLSQWKTHSSNIFRREECTFHYCPNPYDCDKECMSPQNRTNAA